MTIIVSATDANRQFAELLSHAADGETVIITRRGQAVAQLTKVAPKAFDEARERAWDRLLASIDVGLPLGGGKFDRDSLYD